MPSLTIIEHYIGAALKRAKVEILEDGIAGATLPDFPGLVAYGSTEDELVGEMACLIEETIKTFLTRGEALPVIDGIDLNSSAGTILASYHDLSPSTQRGQVYLDDESFERALRECGEPAA